MFASISARSFNSFRSFLPFSHAATRVAARLASMRWRAPIDMAIDILAERKPTNETAAYPGYHERVT